MSRSRPSPAEPVSQLRHVRIVECGEPLVDFREAVPGLLLDRPRFHYRREYLVRASVAEALRAAVAATPKGYRLGIVEGWRPPFIQARMYQTIWGWFQERHPDWSEVQLRRTVNRFTAPMHERVPPPHTTGGAVDVFLLDENGRSLDMHSPYEPTDPKSFPPDVVGLSDEAQRHRAVLHEAMSAGALTNYPSEYWHWSYGDQGWAYRGGHPHALYGPIAPEGWAPDPADAQDGPLLFFGSEETA